HTTNSRREGVAGRQEVAWTVTLKAEVLLSTKAILHCVEGTYSIHQNVTHSTGNQSTKLEELLVKCTNTFMCLDSGLGRIGAGEIRPTWQSLRLIPLPPLEAINRMPHYMLKYEVLKSMDLAGCSSLYQDTDRRKPNTITMSTPSLPYTKDS
uniref:Uncharacterized protein n=1 Tax=Echinococcus canadensis TaxID=519352 RepID=A0A915F0H1_9CEST